MAPLTTSAHLCLSCQRTFPISPPSPHLSPTFLPPSPPPPAARQSSSQPGCTRGLPQARAESCLALRVNPSADVTRCVKPGPPFNPGGDQEGGEASPEASPEARPGSAGPVDGPSGDRLALPPPRLPCPSPVQQGPLEGPCPAPDRPEPAAAPGPLAPEQAARLHTPLRAQPGLLRAQVHAPPPPEPGGWLLEGGGELGSARPPVAPPLPCAGGGWGAHPQDPQAAGGWGQGGGHPLLAPWPGARGGGTHCRHPGQEQGRLQGWGGGLGGVIYTRVTLRLCVTRHLPLPSKGRHGWWWGPQGGADLRPAAELGSGTIGNQRLGGEGGRQARQWARGGEGCGAGLRAGSGVRASPCGSASAAAGLQERLPSLRCLTQGGGHP
ncbi:hypothetical protein HaLaN_06652 [Haematococcus lacustris]|uniref:Uncharacterized protein n=1 Tax=Haematococcus lacustris TaxID=44745 RepID=A0A699YNQ3_HAELA|nr:hypothetical protein HaLaN_06652 [Haematococcus lacustris]